MKEPIRNIYTPAPVNMDAIARTIARTIGAIERSYALISRLDADFDGRFPLEKLGGSNPALTDLDPPGTRTTGIRQ